MIYNILKNKKRGFTLLEMIVSLGIFSLVAVIAVGSLVRITGLNRRAQSLQSAMDNVSFALESMTRNMRYGSGFQCTQESTFSKNSTKATACTHGASNKGILFTSTKTDTNGCPLIHAYWFDKKTDGGGNFIWSIKKSEQTTCGGAIGSDTAVSIVDEKNVTLNNVEFYVLKGTNGYSLAHFKIEGYAGKRMSEQTKFTVQTAVSQRISD
jgi:prepilin-type N-terminal cleavage/methylation domain-containing protein